MASHRTTARAFLLLLLAGIFAGTAKAASVPDVTAFPVVGNVFYIDDFGAPRHQGAHEGNDIMSLRHQPAVAFESGRVEKWASPKGAVPSCMLVLHGKSGMTYWYIHLNNDVTNGNDNDGGCRKAYAPGLENGQHVRRGQLVAFVGDSGDANGIQPHLHFEVHTAKGKPIDPYEYLGRATPLLFPRPQAGLGDLTLKLKGTKVVAKTGSTITVQTKRIVVSPLGLNYVNVRKVNLAVPPEALVERKATGGRVGTTDLTSARIGERARVTTTTFSPSWRKQRARAGALAVAKVLLLG
ncbi:MAG TPA: M23 family metallopeptidase [Gaiellaceae bacterium]|nr:M23 family metallopeptidase [Gaiellaceae bacterium]